MLEVKSCENVVFDKVPVIRVWCSFAESVV
jgi:hypothetical protein